jgi:hypothetical protein
MPALRIARALAFQRKTLRRRFTAGAWSIVLESQSDLRDERAFQAGNSRVFL